MPLRYDISQNYALKEAIEGLLGNEAWLALKETTSIAAWRKQAIRLISAIETAVAATVKAADAGWFDEIAENLERGRSAIKSSKDIEELISALSAMLLRQVFLQLGLLPNRRTDRKVSIRREEWKLDAYRSVVYFQSSEQVEHEFRAQQGKRLSIHEQVELRARHRGSKTKLPYSAWCKKNGL